MLLKSLQTFRGILSAYLQFELQSPEEAIDAAVRFMELHKKHWLVGRARLKSGQCSTRTIWVHTAAALRQESRARGGPTFTFRQTYYGVNT